MELKVTALSVADAARILSAAGGRAISEAAIRAHIEAGSPTNADGTINLIHYAAWLNMEIGRRDND